LMIAGAFLLILCVALTVWITHRHAARQDAMAEVARAFPGAAMMAARGASATCCRRVSCMRERLWALRYPPSRRLIWRLPASGCSRGGARPGLQEAVALLEPTIAPREPRTPTVDASVSSCQRIRRIGADRHEDGAEFRHLMMARAECIRARHRAPSAKASATTPAELESHVPYWRQTKGRHR
jgi:hypothetical protein